MSISDRYRRIAELQSIDDVVEAPRRRSVRTELGVRTEYAPPLTVTEIELSEIWQEVLGLDVVGIDDNFFELAGDSLTMTQVLVRLRDRHEAQISIESFFETPTIRGLAAILAAGSAFQENEEHDGDVRSSPGGE
jgi:acyl carrier protein